MNTQDNLGDQATSLWLSISQCRLGSELERLDALESIVALATQTTGKIQDRAKDFLLRKYNLNVSLDTEFG